MREIIEIRGDAAQAGRAQAARDGEPGDPGTQFGIFLTAFGPVSNQIVRLSRHSRESLPSVIDRWQEQYGAPSDGILFRERTLAVAERDAPFSAQGHSLYELRLYDACAGRARELTDLLLSNIHARERYSPNFGVWTTVTGRTERLIHLWAYVDFADRLRALDEAHRDQEWAAYRAVALPLITNMSVALMTPMQGSALA